MLPTAPCEPPLSFSIKRGDANYCPAWAAIGRTWDVLLDGVEQTRVRAYDCRNGWVRRMVTDADGRVAINDARDAVLEETLRGEVTVAWKVPA